MEQMKQYQMDLEFIKTALTELIDIMESKFFEDLVTYENNRIDINIYKKFIYDLLIKLRFSQQVVDIGFLNFIHNIILPIYSEIKELTKLEKSENSQQKVITILKKLDTAKNDYYTICIEDTNKKVVNSAAYYNSRLQELKKKEADLLNAVKTKTDRSEEYIQNVENEILKATIIKYEKELERISKQEDAEENSKKNIKETFVELKIYLQPIRIEKIRLNRLFWAYLISSLLAVLLIVFIEIVAVVKVISTVGFPSFKEYLTLYLPLPVAGALLWGFIYQMNRAQRQLIVLAKSIHKVEYIQGLLLSINKLAPTIDDGITRINLALDKLINNYFSEKECNSEEDIIKEEKKDIVPVDSLIKLLREIKGVVSKE